MANGGGGRINLSQGSNEADRIVVIEQGDGWEGTMEGLMLSAVIHKGTKTELNVRRVIYDYRINS